MSDTLSTLGVHLSEARVAALRNLSRKQAGHEVGWIAITEAQGLTDLGFAERSRSGWQITESGQAALALLEAAKSGSEDADILRFPGG